MATAICTEPKASRKPGRPDADRASVFTSFDVDAFEVPRGRDEIWRFTPLRRLRGLHDGSAPADRQRADRR